MTLIGPAARQALKSLEVEVLGCRRRVPTRCRGFERAAGELERELTSCLHRWWPPWIREEELARLRERTADLAAGGARFAAFASRLTPLEEKVRWLRHEALSSADPEAQSWLMRQCDGWTGALARLGQAQRPAELHAEEGRLGEAEGEVRLAEEALNVLAELARALASLPGEVAVAPLAAQLAGLREEVLRGRASAEWLRKARRFLSPLADLRTSLPPTGPAEDLVARVTRLQSWSRATGLWVEEVAALVPRLLKGQGRQDELGEQARGLLESLLGAARAGREERLRSLERQLAALVKGCGIQPEQAGFQASLNRLASMAVAEPADHEEWQSQHEQLRRKLADLSQVLEERLLVALTARLETAGEVLTRLRTDDLPAELSAACDALGGRIQTMASLRTWSEVWEQLAPADELVAELLALEAEVASERAVAEELAARRPTVLLEIEALAASELRPEERVEREHCLEELADLGRELPVDVRRRRLALEAAITRAEELLERLRQGERRARALHGVLRGRLKNFHRVDYGLGCTGLIDRVEALVHGVRTSPRVSRAVEEQLAAAEALLDRLERQGRRLASARVDELLTALAGARGGRLDPVARQEVDALLHELHPGADQALPPARWRRRAEGLLQRRGAPATEGGLR